jgi:hypothetical protein
MPSLCSAKAFRGKFKCTGTVDIISNGITTTFRVKAAKMISQIIPAGGDKQTIYNINILQINDTIAGFVAEDNNFTGGFLDEYMESIRRLQCAAQSPDLLCNIYGYRSSITGNRNMTGRQVKFNISDSWLQKKSDLPSESRSNNYILTCKK